VVQWVSVEFPNSLSSFSACGFYVQLSLERIGAEVKWLISEDRAGLRVSAYAAWNKRAYP